MKKIYAVVSTLLIVCLLCSCSLSGYRYTAENGHGYIVLDHTTPSNDGAGQIEAPYIIFKSYREMVADIRNGNFTDDEKNELSRFIRDDEDRIMTFDLDNIYIPVLPDETNETNAEIKWYGFRFHYFFECSFGDVLYTQRADYDEWEFWRDLVMDHSKKNPYCQDTERNATVYKVADDTRYVITFQIETDDVQLYVHEAFHEYPGNPYEITVLGSNGTVHYSLRFSNHYKPLPSRPSIEFLKQIIIERYTEE